jgi:hypothetical protein
VLWLPEVASVLLEPTFQNINRWQEVVPENYHQVDVVEILVATETVCKIVAWVDGGSQFAAGGTLKAKVTIVLFRDRAELAKPRDRQFHRQVVANRS